jgi:hypothetical protein
MKRFGEILTEKMYGNGITLRELWKKMEKNGYKGNASRISKILRDRLNVQTKDELIHLLKSLDLMDRLDELEKLSQKPVEIKDNNIGYPIFINRTFKDEQELNEFYEKFKKLDLD